MGRTWCTEAMWNKEDQSWGERDSLHVTFLFFRAAVRAGKNRSFFVFIGLLFWFFLANHFGGISSVMNLDILFIECWQLLIIFLIFLYEAYHKSYEVVSLPELVGMQKNNLLSVVLILSQQLP